MSLFLKIMVEIDYILRFYCTGRNIIEELMTYEYSPAHEKAL